MALTLALMLAIIWALIIIFERYFNAAFQAMFWALSLEAGVRHDSSSLHWVYVVREIDGTRELSEIERIYQQWTNR